MQSKSHFTQFTQFYFGDPQLTGLELSGFCAISVICCLTAPADRLRHMIADKTQHNNQDFLLLSLL